MKKVISIILPILMIMSSLNIAFVTYAKNLENEVISDFVEDTCDVIKTYDEGKDFEITDDENNFQTCRLIVKSGSSFDTHNSIRHIKGFEDYHILQYKTEAQTRDAYNALSNDEKVISVTIDEVIAPLQGEVKEETSTDVFPESFNGHLCDWATDRTQAAQVNEYIKNNNLPLTDVTVGVVDTGVDYNHEFLQGRIIRTNFNASPDGNENDELDLVQGHGTAVASVVADYTPDSVKIASYRVIGDDGLTTGAASVVGILKAVEDKVDIINASFNGPEFDGISNDAVNHAYENGIAFVSCAGNERYDLDWQWLAPSNADKAIAVSASSYNNRYCYWSNRGLGVAITAPGETVSYAMPNNRYETGSGTSFSSPCIAGIIALIKTCKYEYSYDEILEMLKDNAVLLEEYYSNKHIPTSEPEDCEEFRLQKDHVEMFGAGLVQVGNIFGLNKPNAPVLSATSGNYQYEVNVTITSNCPVYYTTDGTYPTTSSTLYTEPIRITADTDLRAIAYDESLPIKFSTEVEAEYQIFKIATADMLEVDEAGTIISFDSNEKNIIIPDEINGITVRSFTAKVFNNNILEKIILPDTLEELPASAFADNEIISYVNTAGAKTINRAAFYNNSYLFEIDLPNVTVIKTEGFHNCSGKYDGGFKVNAPMLDRIENSGFFKVGLVILIAPELTTLYYRAFNNTDIRCVVFPKLTSLKKTSAIKVAPFYECPSELYVDLPDLESSELISIFDDGYTIQYLNLPKFFGKVAVEKDYYFLRYCNVTKETADLSGIPYKTVNALGGSIRITDAGLRFGFSFTNTDNCNIEEYGFVYTQGECNDFVVGSKGVKTLIANNRITHEDGLTTFNLVFTNIPSSAYDSMISARAYVKIAGTYYYSDILHHSFSSVANAVLADEGLDSDIKNTVKNLINKEA